MLLLNILQVFTVEVLYAKAILYSEDWTLTYIDATADLQNTTSFTANSLTQCSAIASAIEWPNLVCFQKDSNYCLVSDAYMVPVPITSTQQTPCMTRINKYEGCSLELNKAPAILSGQWFIVNQTNEVFECVNGNLKGFQYASSCDAPFHFVTNLGCVLLVKERKNWFDARIYCLQRNSDLGAFDQAGFTSFKNFLIKEGLVLGNIEHEVWVGLTKNAPITTKEIFKFVLTGNTLDPGLWVAGRPDNFYLGPLLCARSRADFNFLVDDQSCYLNFYFMCQIP